MEDVKLDPKAKWRAKNREKINADQRARWRQKQAAKGLIVAEFVGTKQSGFHTLTEDQLKKYHALVLSNFGLTAKSCREVSQKYLIVNNLK